MNVATETTAPASKHPFARAGYVAPYKLMGAVEAWYDALEGSMFNDGSARQPCGSCDVCGACFGHGAQWLDASGREFKTGLVCAEKAQRDYDSESAGALRAMLSLARSDFGARKRKAKNDKRAAERAHDQRQREVEELYSYNALDWEALEKMAHPMDWRAEKGDSYADCVRYKQENGAIKWALQAAEEAMQIFASGKFDPVYIPFAPDTSNSQHVGEFKEKKNKRTGELEMKGVRREFEVRRFAAIPLPDYGFGASYIMKFVDRAGNVIAWKSSDPFRVTNSENKEMWITIKATPKEHAKDKYNTADNGTERPITWISRANFISEKQE